MVKAIYQSIRFYEYPLRAIIQIQTKCLTCYKETLETLECQRFGSIHVQCQTCGNTTVVRYDPDIIREFTTRVLHIQPMNNVNRQKVFTIVNGFIQKVIKKTTNVVKRD